MGNGPNTNEPAVVSAFHTALYHQGLTALIILTALVLGWYGLRFVHLHRTTPGRPGGGALLPAPAPEADARRVLRVGFGLLWVLDGILQAQGAMPLGMVPQVISPAADGSPGWVQHLVNTMATTWTYHPIAAAAAAVWIQVGIGVWLLSAPPGIVSRLAGVASAGWGLTIWMFGEAFGGIFGGGLSWLSGAPGAVLIYCVAGVLVALPDGHWRSPRLGRAILGTTGVFFVGMALLQAWPGRGFWEGRAGHGATLGSLPSLVRDMSQTPQPHWLSSWVASFGGFDAAHGWAVNLFVVIALAVIGVAFLTGRPRVVRPAVVAATLLCLADWVLVEDLGFFGGVGTDPNSMIPMVLVFVAGYLARTGRPGLWPGTGVAARARSVQGALSQWRERVLADPTYASHAVVALAAVGVTILGAAPMAAAAVKPNADPLIATAAFGAPEVTNIPTPPFSLIDQHGRTVSLPSLRGKTVVLTFVDPTCIDQPVGCAATRELRLADRLLGRARRRVEWVAIDTNPRFLKPDELVAFDRHAGLDYLGNWRYLTGSRRELGDVLNSFAVHLSSGGSNMRLMMGLPHGQLAYVIDGSGRTRDVFNIGDRGQVSKVMVSSMAVSLARAVERVRTGQSG